MNDGIATTKAPFLTKHAKYTWADLFEAEIEEGARATITIRGAHARVDQEFVLDVEDAPDLIALLQHALDSRQSGPR